jgi:hypothetical protein
MPKKKASAATKMRELIAIMMHDKKDFAKAEALAGKLYKIIAKQPRITGLVATQLVQCKMVEAQEAEEASRKVARAPRRKSSKKTASAAEAA